MSKHTATLISKNVVSSNICILTFKCETKIKYRAGQYVNINVEGYETRSYSIANAPIDDGSDTLEFHIGKGRALSKYLFRNIKVGDTCVLGATSGKTVFKSVCNKPIIAIAGGTGLSQIKAIVETALQKKLANPIVLYHGARKAEGLYMHEYFLKLEQSNPLFSYKFAISDETFSGIPHGYITDILNQDFENFSKHRAYICGPAPMVDVAKSILLNKSIDPKRIHAEDWSL